jgi:glycine oxidase
VGLSLARALARRGADVLLIEARRVGAGASGAAAGILPQPGVGASLLQRLARSAHSGYARFVEEIQSESGLPVEFRRTGYAEVALVEEAEEELRSLAGDEKTAGGLRWLSPSDLRNLAPGIAGSARGALFAPDAHWVNARLLLNALRASAERLGVKVLEGKAAGLAPGDRPGEFEAVLGGCGGERLAGREVVIAAGAWSGEILGEAGVGPAAPIVPVRGQMVELEYAPPLATILDHGGAYLIPRPGGTVWVGATVEEVGFDEKVSEEGIRSLTEFARKLLPGIGGLRRAWAGLRPKCLRRGGPLLGEGEPPVLAGHYRSGIHLGPLTAHLLAARLLDDPSALSPFENTFDVPP